MQRLLLRCPNLFLLGDYCSTLRQQAGLQVGTVGRSVGPAPFCTVCTVLIRPDIFSVDNCSILLYWFVDSRRLV